jgi:hypothetical protein
MTNDGYIAQRVLVKKFTAGDPRKFEVVRIMSNGDDPTHWDFDALMVHNKPRASRKSPIHLSPIHHPWTAERAAIAVSEPSTLTGYQPSIDTVGNRTTVVESGSWKQQRYC